MQNTWIGSALGLNNIEIILVSICAGIGEGILFRVFFKTIWVLF